MFESDKRKSKYLAVENTMSAEGQTFTLFKLIVSPTANSKKAYHLCCSPMCCIKQKLFLDKSKRFLGKFAPAAAVFLQDLAGGRLEKQAVGMWVPPRQVMLGTMTVDSFQSRLFNLFSRQLLLLLLAAPLDQAIPHNLTVQALAMYFCFVYKCPRCLMIRYG